MGPGAWDRPGEPDSSSFPSGRPEMGKPESAGPFFLDGAPRRPAFASFRPDSASGRPETVPDEPLLVGAEPA